MQNCHVILSKMYTTAVFIPRSQLDKEAFIFNQFCSNEIKCAVQLCL